MIPLSKESFYLAPCYFIWINFCAILFTNMVNFLHKQISGKYGDLPEFDYEINV
jgi:hypothetical protein